MARNKTSKAWMHEHVNDTYVKQAKADGYRSRAAYKLLQMDAKDKLLRPGGVVVDLGSAPGGWSQVAAAAVGPTGRVVAVDLLEMTGIHGVTFIQGDFGHNAVLDAVTEALAGRSVDLVLSDMAPNMTGIGAVDQAAVAGLAELSLDFALRFLGPKGSLLVKVFHGVGFDDLLKQMRRSFREVVVRKPEASRGRSPETYLLARMKQLGADGQEAAGEGTNRD